MRTVSVAEARRTLKALLDEVSAGHQVSVATADQDLSRSARSPALRPRSFGPDTPASTTACAPGPESIRRAQPMALQNHPPAVEWVWT